VIGGVERRALAGGGVIHRHAGLEDLTLGRAPWVDVVPWPHPDFDNINPRPIRGLPLPEAFASQFANLARVSLRGLTLGWVPEALRGLPSLRTLDLRDNLLRELPSWLSGMAVSELELANCGLGDSWLRSSAAATALPKSLQALGMGSMLGVDPMRDPYDALSNMPCVVGSLPCLEQLVMSDNQLDLRPSAMVAGTPPRTVREEGLYRRLRRLSLRGVRTNCVPRWLGVCQLCPLCRASC
jgi:hypothetical protein